jgi:hypothetical protein
MGAKARTGEFDYLEHVLKIAGPRSEVTVKLAEGTDHSFANLLGRKAVEQHTEDWLRSHFPLADKQHSSQSVALEHSPIEAASWQLASGKGMDSKLFLEG